MKQKLVLLILCVFLIPSFIFSQKNSQFEKWKAEDNKFDKEFQYTKDSTIRIVVSDTLCADSVIFQFYQNGATCTQSYYFHGLLKSYREYYSNGQIKCHKGVTKGEINNKTGSMPLNYGKYCYLYGFKINKRMDMMLNFDGSPLYISFQGIYNNKRVEIDIEFLYGKVSGAWIRKNGRLMQQFDWNDKLGTWDHPNVNHMIPKCCKGRQKLKKGEIIIM